MKVKKVLIIGGSGFLGSSVVDEFIKKKNECDSFG